MSEEGRDAMTTSMHPIAFEDEAGRQYTETTRGNGWRIAGKIAAAIAVPLMIQLVLAGVWAGHMTARLESAYTMLAETRTAVQAIDRRVDRLERLTEP
jgi:hypothetical protein